MEHNATIRLLQKGGVTCLLWLAFGCSNESPDAPNAIVGIYQVNDYLVNELACTEAPASDDAATHPHHLIVVEQELAGQPVHRVVLCGALDQCIDVRDALLDGQNIPNAAINVLLTQRIPMGATGQDQSSGFTTDRGWCEAPQKVVNQLRVDNAGVFEFTQRLTRGMDYPETEDGFCTTNGGANAVNGQPCSGLTILRGQKVL